MTYFFLQIITAAQESKLALFVLDAMKVSENKPAGFYTLCKSSREGNIDMKASRIPKYYYTYIVA